MPGVLCQAGTWTKVQKPLGAWQQDAVPSPPLERFGMFPPGSGDKGGCRAKGAAVSVHGQFPTCTSLEQ